MVAAGAEATVVVEVLGDHIRMDRWELISDGGNDRCRRCSLDNSLCFLCSRRLSTPTLGGNGGLFDGDYSDC